MGIVLLHRISSMHVMHRAVTVKYIKTSRVISPLELQCYSDATALWHEISS